MWRRRGVPRRGCRRRMRCVPGRDCTGRARRRAGSVSRNAGWRRDADRLHSTGRGWSNACGMDWPPNGLSNLSRRWAGVPLGTSVVDRLLDRAGHRVRPMETLHGNGIVVDVAHYELLDRSEAPGPIEAGVDGEADGGKRNPTDVAITKAPIHPGRTPHRVWNPYPTVVVGEKPPP